MTMVDVDVSYGQLAVFINDIAQPFNDWTEKHVAQGFAWRPGSVSFLTLVEDGRHLVKVDVVEHLHTMGSDVIRAIEVPFEVPVDGAIEVGSISDTALLTLPSGAYLLRCEFLRPSDRGDHNVHLSFARKDVPRFAVVRADEVLSLDGELLEIAGPAQ